MMIHKTKINNRENYRYTFQSPIEINGERTSVITIKPGEDGVTEANIKMLHAEDDSEVYYNNKNLRPARTDEEIAEIKAWKEKYIERFKARHGYEPNKDDVKYVTEEHFPRNYNLSLDFDADGELEVDKSHLNKAFSVTNKFDFDSPWSDRMDEALSTLTNKQRHVVELMFKDEFKQSEIANLLGISSAGVKKHLDSSISRLKKFFGEKS